MTKRQAQGARSASLRTINQRRTDGVKLSQLHRRGFPPLTAPVRQPDNPEQTKTPYFHFINFFSLNLRKKEYLFP